MAIENPDELTTFVGHLKRIRGLGRIYKRAGRGGGGGERDLHQHVTGIIRRPICFVITNHIFETRSEPNAPMPPPTLPPLLQLLRKESPKVQKERKATDRN